MKLSGCTGQPGTLTIGNPAFDFQSQPRKSRKPMQPVGLPCIAWMPPQVAQLPAPTTARALGASRVIQSLVLIGCPVAASVPIAAQ